MSKHNRDATTRSSAAALASTPAYWTAPRLSKAEKALLARVTALGWRIQIVVP